MYLNWQGRQNPRNLEKIFTNSEKLADWLVFSDLIFRAVTRVHSSSAEGCWVGLEVVWSSCGQQRLAGGAVV